jgi:hypothetical protein
MERVSNSNILLLTNHEAGRVVASAIFRIAEDEYPERKKWCGMKLEGHSDCLLYPPTVTFNMLKVLIGQDLDDGMEVRKCVSLGPVRSRVG